MISEIENPSESRDLHLALALIAGKTHREAAIESGYSERTVARRIQDAAFVRQLRQARSDVFDRSLNKLATASLRAADELQSLLDSANERIRLHAAKTILDAATKIRAENDLDTELQELRTLIESKKRF